MVQSSFNKIFHLGKIHASTKFMATVLSNGTIIESERSEHTVVLSLRFYYNWRASEASETLSGLFNRESRIYDLLHGSACNMTRYLMSSDSIVTSRRRVEIQSTSEMSPYFTMTKCNKLFITYLTRSTERLPSLLSSISTISMTVVMTALFKKR